MVVLALGHRRFDDHGKSLLKLFGMNGSGVSFICDSCAAEVQNRLPIRRGSLDDRWYCSMPCAWMDSNSENDMERLFRWLSIGDPESNSPIKALVIQRLVAELEHINWPTYDPDYANMEVSHA